MNYPQRAKSKWPQQNLVVISRSPNLHMLLKELVRGFGWNVLEATDNVDEAIISVREGRAFMIVIDDTIDVPAISIMRMLLTDSVTCCTPVLSFLLDHHRNEAPALAKMGTLAIVEKPLTPSKFIPKFRNLVQTWESQTYVALRMAVHQYLRAGPEAGFNTVKKLVGIDQISSQVSQNLSIEYRNRGNILEAEKTLLRALKSNPKDLGTMLALGDLYMHSAMPKIAYRLFQGARSIFGDTMAIFPDLVQAAIMLDLLDEAAEYLTLMNRREFVSEQTLDFLCRLQFANGKPKEAEKLLAIKKGLYKKMKIAWENTSDEKSILAS